MGRSEVAVGEALGKDRLGNLPVQGQALGLLVLFVPGQPKPAQSLEDRLNAGVRVALDIGIVEAEYHGAPVVAGIQPIEDKGARGAHVKEARGRGRESDSQHKNVSINAGRYCSRKIKAPHETDSAGHGANVRLVAGLRLVHWGGCGFNHGAAVAARAASTAAFFVRFRSFCLRSRLNRALSPIFPDILYCFLCTTICVRIGM